MSLHTRTLWIDLETTGIDPKRDLVLEVGLVVADEDLLPIAGRSIVIDPGGGSDGVSDLIGDSYVMEMHERSGLLDDIDRRGCTPDHALREIHALIDVLFPIEHQSTDRPGTIFIGGSGIDRFDVPFLAAWSPGLVERFHYRTLDVSGAKVLLHAAGVTSERFTDRRSTEGEFDYGTEILQMMGPDRAHRGVADCYDALFTARAIRDLMHQGAR